MTSGVMTGASVPKSSPRLLLLEQQRTAFDTTAQNLIIRAAPKIFIIRAAPKIFRKSLGKRHSLGVDKGQLGC